MSNLGKQRVIKLRPYLCTGCRSCEVACSFMIKGVCDPTKSRVKISRNGETGRVTADLPATCPENCCHGQPPCVEVCIFGALKSKGYKLND